MGEQPNAEGNKRIAKNTLFLYIRLVFILVISLYTSRVILHNLGVVDYGIYNVVAGFVSMFAMLNTSLSGSCQRFYNYEKGKNGIEGMQKVFVSAQFIQIIIAVLILLFAETIGLWYVSNKMVYPPERSIAVHVVYQSAIVALLFVVLQIPYSAAIIAHEKINYYAIVGVLDVVLKLIVTLVLPLIPADSLSVYGILIVGVSIADFLLYYIYSCYHFPYLRIRKIFYRENFVEMIKYSGWSAFNAFSQTVRHQGLNILMNFFFGPVVNAARGIAYQVKSALLGFVMNITTAAQPQVVESYAAGNIDRSKKLMFTISKLIFLSLYVVVLPIILEVNYVLRLWLGNKIPEYTEVFTVLVLVTTLVDILATPIGMIIAASGRVAKLNFWTSVLGMSSLPLAYVFLKNGEDPVSVFVASFMASVAIQIATVIILKRETGIKISDYSKGILLPLFYVVITTFFFPLMFFYLLPQGIARLLMESIITFVCVLCSGYYIALDSNEQIIVVSYIKHFFIKNSSKLQ